MTCRSGNSGNQRPYLITRIVMGPPPTKAVVALFKSISFHLNRPINLNIRPFEVLLCFELRLRSRYSDLRAGRPRGRSSCPGGSKSFLHVVQTNFGAHPATISAGSGGFAAGREASAEVKKMWIYTSTPPYAYVA
jgi:hypothetical protein